MDDVAVVIEGLVIRVDASKVVCKRTALVGREDSVVWVLKLAAATAPHASNNKIRMFEIVMGGVPNTRMVNTKLLCIYQSR